jgi:hypothetical protein
MGLSICSNGQAKNGYALSISLNTMKTLGIYVARIAMSTYVTLMGSEESSAIGGSTDPLNGTMPNLDEQ